LNALKYKAYFIPLHTFFLLRTICSILTDLVSANAWRCDSNSPFHLKVLQAVSESLNIGLFLIGLRLVSNGWCIFRKELSTPSLLSVVLPSFLHAVSYCAMQISEEQRAVVLALILNFIGFVGYVTSTAHEIDRMTATIRKLGKSEPQIQAKFRLACGFLRLLFMVIVAIGVFFFMFTLTNAPPATISILRAVHEIILSGGCLEFFLIRDEYIHSSHPPSRLGYRHVTALLEPDHRVQLVMTVRSLSM
jgi:hypothetical protein